MYTARGEYFYHCLASEIWNKANNHIVAGLMANIALDMILSGKYYG